MLLRYCKHALGGGPEDGRDEMQEVMPKADGTAGMGDANVGKSTGGTKSEPPKISRSTQTEPWENDAPNLGGTQSEPPKKVGFQIRTPLFRRHWAATQHWEIEVAVPQENHYPMRLQH